MGVPLATLATGATPLLRRFVPALALVMAACCACVMAIGVGLASAISPAPSTSTALASGEIESVVRFAEEQVGTPYLWGGEGVGGYDCSGLVWAAFRSAGIEVPRVAQDQFDYGDPLSAMELPQRGDLVFFGASPSSIDHVGIVVGPDRMVDAPHAGVNVRIENFHWSDYIGATRPGVRR